MSFDPLAFQHLVIRSNIRTSREDLVALAILVERQVKQAENDAVMEYKRKREEKKRKKETPAALHERLIRYARKTPEVMNEVNRGKKIQAIKELRARYTTKKGFGTVGLKEAKDAIDAIFMADGINTNYYGF